MYILWNIFLWNRHISLARRHDRRVQGIDRTWREHLSVWNAYFSLPEDIRADHGEAINNRTTTKMAIF